MYKYTLALLLGIALVLTVRAEETSEAAPVKGPSVHVEEPNFNFGVADSSDTIEHTFVIKNVGDETLEIANAKPSCGCTVASLTERSVPPGGESQLTAKLSLRGRRGHQSKSITINSNDPEKPQYRLTMAGEVHQAIQISPDRLIFGQLAPGQEVTLNVELNATADKPFQILKIETNNDHLMATSEQEESGTAQKVIATLTAPETVGPINAIVRITTDHPEKASIDIPVAANVVGDLVYAPAELQLPAQSTDSVLTRYVVVRKGTVEGFEIKEVITPDESITSTIYPFGNQGYRIQLGNLVVSEELDGKEIRILTSAENMSEITIPIVLR